MEKKAVRAGEGLLSRDMKQERQVLLEPLVGTHQLDVAGSSSERMYSP